MQPEVFDDAEHRVVFEEAAERGRISGFGERLFELGAVADAVVHDRQRRERDDRDAGVDREHGEHDEVHGLRHLPARIGGLLGHVRDRLDARVGEHRQRQREDQFLPARHAAEVHLVDQQRRVEDERKAEADEQDLGAEVDDREHEVELGRLAEPADVQPGQQRDHDQAPEDVVRVVLERAEAGERAQVVRHEERRDRDREDVVEAQRPAGEERDDVVEGVARERGGAARFGEHRGALGVRFRGQREQPAGEHEDQRRQPERVRGDEPERVVDRGADVAVGGREHPRDPDRLAQSALG